MQYSLEAEQAVLCAILKDGQFDAATSLHAETFHLKKHQEIFRAMVEVADEGKAVDLVTITTRLQEKHILDTIGGAEYLFSLVDAFPATSNIQHYIDILHEKHLHRQTILILQNALTEATQSDEPRKVLNSVSAAVLNLTDPTKEREIKTIRDVARNCFDQVETRYNLKSNITGIPSGFTDLDNMTSGFQKADFIIFAARPSVGKTAFALNVAENVGENETVAVFSLEMSAEQLVQRMLSAEGNIDGNRLRTGRLDADDWEKLTMATAHVCDKKILIDDSAMLTVSDIRAKCHKIKKQYGLGLVLIDYLQLIAGRGRHENRQQEVSDISRSLKALAKELEVPVIALSQLSRSVEQRQDKRPMLSDLRESGSIEQDADIVAFLYRDDYYNKETEKKGIIEIMISKQRNGPVGTVELVFMKNFNKFVNLDRGHYEPPRKEADARRQWA